VVLGESGQRAAREHPQVRLAGRTEIALGEVGRVAQDDLVADMAGSRLPPDHERGDVVPAREVVRRHHGVAVGAQHASDLPHERVGVRQVLDDLVGVDDVDRPVLEGQPRPEVGDYRFHAGGPGGGGRGLDELDPEDPRRLDAAGPAHREASVAAAQVEQDRALADRARSEDRPAVELLGGPEHPLQVAHHAARTPR